MRDDRGSVTLVTASIVGLLVVLAAGLAAAGLLVAAESRAQAAADAAALAAVPLTFRPSGSVDTAYREAARYAGLNGATLVGCRGCSLDRSWRARIVEIEVVVDVALPGVGSVGVTGLAAAEFAPARLLGAR